MKGSISMTTHEINKISLDKNNETKIKEHIFTFEQLRKILTKSLNATLKKQNTESLLINDYILINNNKLTIDINGFLDKFLKNKTLRDKKELSKRLMKSAKLSFAKFLYYVTLQQKATRMANLEAESFLLKFLLTGTKTYHFHIEGAEYYVEFIRLVLPSKEPLENINKMQAYKKAKKTITEKLLKLKMAILANAPQEVEKLFREISLIIDKTLALYGNEISNKDFQTIQKLKQDMENDTIVSPVIIKSKETLSPKEKKIITPTTVSEEDHLANNKSYVADLGWHEILILISHKIFGKKKHSSENQTHINLRN